MEPIGKPKLRKFNTYRLQGLDRVSNRDWIDRREADSPHSSPLTVDIPLTGDGELDYSLPTL